MIKCARTLMDLIYIFNFVKLYNIEKVSGGLCRCVLLKNSGVPRGGLGCSTPSPRNSEVLTKLNLIAN